MLRSKIILIITVSAGLLAGTFAFKVQRGVGNLFAPGATFTTTVGGSIYYSTTTTLLNYLEVDGGTRTLYFRTYTTLAGGQRALTNAVYTAALPVAL
jgi:hypothetical protein